MAFGRTHEDAWGPVLNQRVVVPSDSTVFEASVLRVTADGNVVYHPIGNPAGVNITLTGLTAGTVLFDVQVDMVLATGTTASLVRSY